MGRGQERRAGARCKAHGAGGCPIPLADQVRPPSPGDNVDEAILIALHGDEPLTRDHPHVATAIEIQERHSDRLMAHEAIVGHGIGINDEGRTSSRAI